MKKRWLILNCIFVLPAASQAACESYPIYEGGDFYQAQVGKVILKYSFFGSPEYHVYLDSYLDRNQQEHACRKITIAESTNFPAEAVKAAAKFPIMAYTLNHYLEGYALNNGLSNLGYLSLKRKTE